MKRIAWLFGSVVLSMVWTGNLTAQVNNPLQPPQSNPFTQNNFQPQQYNPFQTQQYAPYQAPLISPYLNLLRPGNAAFNYFYYVKPTVDFTKAMQDIQKQVHKEPPPKMATTAPPTTEGGLPSTGSRLPGYFTHGKYFQTQGSQLPSNLTVPRQTTAARTIANKNASKTNK